MDKTAASVLQEMMVKLGTMPEYECITQSGPQHSAMFEYRCFALGNTVRAAARSKKEAKQEAARAMLACLAAQGSSVPPHFRHMPPPPDPMLLHCSGVRGSGQRGMVSTHDGSLYYWGAVGQQQHPSMQIEGGSGGGGDVRSCVLLLRDLCEQYRLPAPEYSLVGDTGPPHARHFTLSAAVGQHERRATASTKKMARQLAAEQLYLYLRENLSRLTKDYDEEEALARGHERAMERYVELRAERDWRPDLGQKIADYHLGLLTHIDEDKRNTALEVLGGPTAVTDEDSAEALAEAAAAALGLTATWAALRTTGGGELALLELAPTSPELTFAGTSRVRAAFEAIGHLRLALSSRLAPAAPTPVATTTATATATAAESA